MTVSLVALVGADGNIGPEGGLPIFADNDARDAQTHWFLKLAEGSLIVMGTKTIQLMQRAGFSGMDGLRPWSRSYGVTPEEFLADLGRDRRHIIIAGGATTFRVFAPFCDNYYLRRVSLVNVPDYRLDPILSVWQNRVTRADDFPNPRPS